MLVLFRPSPRSIVKAFIATKVHKAKPIPADEGKKLYFEEAEDADALDYDSLYSQHKEQFGGLDFLEDPKLWEIVEDEVFWASRYNSPDRFQLIFTVLGQIERTGTKAYLAQTSAESKEMKDRVRRVTGEFRRAKQYIAFSADRANKVLVGHASFEHLIADLVLRHYAKKSPGFTIVILDEEHAHICYRDEILVDSRKRYPERPSRRDSSRYWMLMSDLKHMESLKDPDYDTAEKPANYWKWVGDGADVFGTIPRVTLDDFNV